MTRKGKIKWLTVAALAAPALIQALGAVGVIPPVLLRAAAALAGALADPEPPLL